MFIFVSLTIQFDVNVPLNSLSFSQQKVRPAVIVESLNLNPVQISMATVRTSFI